MPQAITDAGEVGYDLAGESGPPVVFLHGVGSDRRVWREQLAEFGRDHRAAAVDLPGKLVLDPSRSPVTRSSMARDVVAVLDDLALDRAHVVGLSMGGVVALELYRLHPERVLSLTLANTFARYAGWEAGMRTREQDLRRMSMREIAEARIPACLKADPDPAMLRAAIDQMAGKEKRVYAESSAATWSPDYRSLLPEIEVPVLVLWGEHDTITPRELSEELREGITGAVLRVIPDAGHISNLDNPSAFSGELRSFLRHADASTAEGARA